MNWLTKWLHTFCFSCKSERAGRYLPCASPFCQDGMEIRTRGEEGRGATLVRMAASAFRAECSDVPRRQTELLEDNGKYQQRQLHSRLVAGNNGTLGMDGRCNEQIEEFLRSFAPPAATQAQERHGGSRLSATVLLFVQHWSFLGTRQWHNTALQLLSLGATGEQTLKVIPLQTGLYIHTYIHKQS